MTPAEVPPCPVCSGKSRLFDMLDFNKICGPQDLHVPAPSGIAIYYALCKSCGFCFAPELLKWAHAQFAQHIYNDDYILVDPEYAAIRPRAFHHLLQQAFGEHASGFSHIDYGGGNGTLAKMLCDTGWNSRSYDPFSNPDVNPDALGQFDLVTAFEVFEHVPDVHALMHRLTTLLKEDGVLFFATQLSDGQILPGQRLTWNYAAPRNGHISLYCKASLEYVAKQYGFNLASDWHSLHLMYRNKPAWAAKVLT